MKQLSSSSPRHPQQQRKRIRHRILTTLFTQFDQTRFAPSTTMQFSKLSVAALFGLLATATAAVAAPAPDAAVARSAEPASEPEVYADEDLEVLVKRQGFGCPLNQTKCHNHVSGFYLNKSLRIFSNNDILTMLQCRSISGYRGGYCEGILRQRCRCYT